MKNELEKLYEVKAAFEDAGMSTREIDKAIKMAEDEARRCYRADPTMRGNRGGVQICPTNSMLALGRLMIEAFTNGERVSYQVTWQPEGAPDGIGEVLLHDGTITNYVKAAAYKRDE